MHKTYLCRNPLIQTRLADIRDKTTPMAVFRRYMQECGALMSYEIAADFPTVTTEVETPLEKIQVQKIGMGLTIVAILRAAIGFVEGLAQYLPQAKIGHFGIYRNEETLAPIRYYAKMPKDIDKGWVILADPMLATGGSILAALDDLIRLGCRERIKIAALIAAPEGIAAVHAVFPEVPIFTAAIDRELNDKGYILPGLGDAGDRIYGTI